MGRYGVARQRLRIFYCGYITTQTNVLVKNICSNEHNFGTLHIPTLMMLLILCCERKKSTSAITAEVPRTLFAALHIQQSFYLADSGDNIIHGLDHLKQADTLLLVDDAVAGDINKCAGYLVEIGSGISKLDNDTVKVLLDLYGRSVAQQKISGNAEIIADSHDLFSVGQGLSQLPLGNCLSADIKGIGKGLLRAAAAIPEV
jgi:hypothetical protein